jgi:hypothetical protein
MAGRWWSAVAVGGRWLCVGVRGGRGCRVWRTPRAGKEGGCEQQQDSACGPGQLQLLGRVVDGRTRSTSSGGGGGSSSGSGLQG